MKRLVCGAMIAVWLTSLLTTGCEQQTTQVSHGIIAADPDASEESLEKTQVLASDLAAEALADNLSLEVVSAFVDTLESWGYIYRQSASLVMIRERYRRATVPEDEVVNKVCPEGAFFYEHAGSDTLIWQVFENAVADSGLHTAVLTICSEGESQSVFMEGDVSTSNLQFVRGGILQPNGELSDSVMARDLWKDYSECVLACCAAAAVLCLLTGPGWPACTAAACLDCYPGCIVGVAVIVILNSL